MIHVETERLILRDWNIDSDATALNAIDQDPKVLKHLPKPLKPATVDETAARITEMQKRIDDHGFGMFACELKDTGKCIGFVGLQPPRFSAHFTPCIEIGWRIASQHWGNGYATEAAKTLVHKGFTEYALDRIVAFTVPQNMASRRVMKKLGFTQVIDGDFQHPLLPEDHPLSWHVLYQLVKEA